MDSATTRVHAAAALLPTGIARGVVIERQGDLITTVRPASAGDPPPEPGLLIPGLVNAHLHLELSWAAGLVPGGDGLPAWVGRLMSHGRPAGLEARESAAHAMRRAGVAAVCDVSNSGDTAATLDAAGVVGVVQHELLGFSRATLPERLVAAATPDRAVRDVSVRPSPHAVYSTPGELIVAACRPGRFPASIHLSEDEAEAAFTLRGEGPFAELVDRLGVDWRWWTAPGLTPAAWLDRLGVLGPGLLVVHGVHLSPDDRRLLARRGSPLVLCPRSNVHVGGRLPDLPALLADGVRLALGTDSLASCPDLDPLGDVAALLRAFPSVGAELLLGLATTGGAAALGLAEYGRIAAGARPGLLLLEVDDPRALADGPPPRRWVS